MIRRGTRHRAGITLTEILISILIMGVGMLSLATLFPLGVLRLRDAARASRSSLMTASAIDEMSSRNLLYKFSFFTNGYPYDPFTQDPIAGGGGLDRINGPGLTGGRGLPVAYDPLWWYLVFQQSNGTLTPVNTGGRFASGLGFVRPDLDGNPPAAYGLQRITNFPLQVLPGPTYTVDVGPIFASTDDMVMQTEGNPTQGPGFGSPIVPDLTRGMQVDYSYSWMFTGKQTDVTNGTIFDGDIVIFHNRPFALDNGVLPITGAAGPVVAGETVVEGVFGYGTTVDASGYSPNDTSVLLRWSAKMPDPDVRVGGWIADVTYERNATNELSRFYNVFPGRNTFYPAQRCHWYRMVKRTQPSDDPNFSGFRQMIVTVDSPVRAKTQLTTGGVPVHVNAALVSPYVVNVYSKVFYIR